MWSSNSSWVCTQKASTTANSINSASFMNHESTMHAYLSLDTEACVEFERGKIPSYNERISIAEPSAFEPAVFTLVVRRSLNFKNPTPPLNPLRKHMKDAKQTVFEEQQGASDLERYCGPILSVHTLGRSWKRTLFGGYNDKAGNSERRQLTEVLLDLCVIGMVTRTSRLSFAAGVID